MRKKPFKTRPLRRPIRCTRQEYLLTHGELAFYRVLIQSLSDAWIVFAKVRVRDVLRYHNTVSARSDLNRISQKHVDFVICERWTTRIVAALELDDKTHARPDRIARDILLNDAFKAASVPLIRIKARSEYSAQIVAWILRWYVKSSG